MVKCSMNVRILSFTTSDILLSERFYSSDVEHAAAQPNGVSRGALPLPHLKYEGFEPSPYDAEDARLADLERVPASVSG
jgi:hypothetical protein